MTVRPINDRRRLASCLEKHGTAKIWQIVWISCYIKLLPQSFSLWLFKRGLEFRPAWADFSNTEQALDEILQSDSCDLVLLGSISLLDPAKVQKLDRNIASTSKGVLTIRAYSFLDKWIYAGLSECQFRILLWYIQSWESWFLLIWRFHHGKIPPFLIQLLISNFHQIIVPNSFTPEACW